MILRREDYWLARDETATNHLGWWPEEFDGRAPYQRKRSGNAGRKSMLQRLTP